jgi:hypothetical protein
MVKRFEDLALDSPNQPLMAVQQLVDDLPAVLPFINDPLPQISVSLSIRVFNSPKVRLKTYGELIDLANPLFCFKTVKNLELTGVDCGKLCCKGLNSRA